MKLKEIISLTIIVAITQIIYHNLGFEHTIIFLLIMIIWVIPIKNNKNSESCNRDEDSLE